MAISSIEKHEIYDCIFSKPIYSSQSSMFVEWHSIRLSETHQWQAFSVRTRCNWKFWVDFISKNAQNSHEACLTQSKHYCCRWMKIMKLRWRIHRNNHNFRLNYPYRINTVLSYTWLDFPAKHLRCCLIVCTSTHAHTHTPLRLRRPFNPAQDHWTKRHSWQGGTDGASPFREYSNKYNRVWQCTKRAGLSDLQFFMQDVEGLLHTLKFLN